MAGNVWEWTRSLWGENSQESDFRYPYDPADGREDLDAGDNLFRIVRGGSFNFNRWLSQCAFRVRVNPSARDRNCGFRVVVSPISPASAL
jgi:iron(II)-dependent oxidoreductase